ncbi:gastrin-releasing peptide [Cynoglossus semilaevis]|uniref:gastrin-releasing peptide n=1 Tax=Cynoglossus semilaevis TaxID=244447 RepID=UPI0004979433|nr:gastrin-releasing peptide [Cynoglossus semilaevis]XP_016894395.1 gastrin-releasing peptide [Cynoglossus semilaevis]
MREVCSCCPWTGRAVWPLFLFLVSLPCVFHCSQSQGAVVGKMYLRGNHWAVGHLMGKKSTEGLLREIHRDSDYLTAFDRAEVTDLQSHDGLIKTLMQQKKPKQKPHTADRLIHLRSLWIEDNTDKYVGEISHLLALKLQNKGSK